MWLGYVRVSRVGDRAERLVSPSLQAERILGYATAHGLQLEMLDPELDVSGGKVRRPILDHALARIEAGEAQGLIVAQLDRLSRLDIASALAVIQRIENADGQVIAIAENFDASTPEGELGRNVFLALARMQRRRYATGFEDARRRAIERGIWIAKVPIGYRLGADRRLTPDCRMARRVVGGFRARAGGQSWTAVGKILGKGPSGAAWVIRSRVYLGEVVINGIGENRSAHPAIVDRALWEAAQLDFPRPPRGSGGPALLAGLIRCAGCQRLMSPRATAYNCVPSNNRGGRCGEPASIDRSIVEEFVWGQVRGPLGERRFTREPRTDAISEAEAGLARAEAELEAFQQATQVVGEVQRFAAGLRSRVETVEEARGQLGRSRVGAAYVGRLGDVEWTEAERRHLLRAALGAVWVRSAHRRKVPVAERVKLVKSIPPNLSRGPVVPVAWEKLE